MKHNSGNKYRHIKNGDEWRLAEKVSVGDGGGHNDAVTYHTEYVLINSTTCYIKIRREKLDEEYEKIGQDGDLKRLQQNKENKLGSLKLQKECVQEIEDEINVINQKIMNIRDG